MNRWTGESFFFNFLLFFTFLWLTFFNFFLSLSHRIDACVWYGLFDFAYYFSLIFFNIGIPMRLYNPKKKKKKFSCSTLTFLGLIFSFFIGVSISLFFGKKKIQNFFKIEGHFLTKNKKKNYSMRKIKWLSMEDPVFCLLYKTTKKNFTKKTFYKKFLIIIIITIHSSNDHFGF